MGDFFVGDLHELNVLGGDSNFENEEQLDNTTKKYENDNGPVNDTAKMDNNNERDQNIKCGNSTETDNTNNNIDNEDIFEDIDNEPNNNENGVYNEDTQFDELFGGEVEGQFDDASDDDW